LDTGTGKLKSLTILDFRFWILDWMKLFPIFLFQSKIQNRQSKIILRSKIMPMKIGDTIPTFAGATGWLNELQETADDYVKGAPTLVYFWATSCGICKDNMPKLAELKSKFKPQGLETGKATIEKHSIDDVCAIDNQHKLKDAFLNEQGWVPVYYLFDPEGKLKSRAAGEFGIGVISGALEKMFASQSVTA
jgi:thiol-disulfide isomerase/thioredoxin